jgi:hypothetical protein
MSLISGLLSGIVYNRSQLSSTKPKEGDEDHTSRIYFNESRQPGLEPGVNFLLTRDQFWPTICMLDGRELKTLER